MTPCLDLKAKFGQRYRVKLNRESYLAEPEQFRTVEKPWHYAMLCRYGEIYPHGGDLLGVATNRRGNIANRLQSLDCVEVVQDADDGINAVFNVADFAIVAKIMRPRRRRQLTEQQRANLAAASQAYRFGKTTGLASPTAS